MVTHKWLKPEKAERVCGTNQLANEDIHKKGKPSVDTMKVGRRALIAGRPSVAGRAYNQDSIKL